VVTLPLALAPAFACSPVLCLCMLVCLSLLVLWLRLPGFIPPWLHSALQTPASPTLTDLAGVLAPAGSARCEHPRIRRLQAFKVCAAHAVPPGLTAIWLKSAYFRQFFFFLQNTFDLGACMLLVLPLPPWCHICTALPPMRPMQDQHEPPRDHWTGHHAVLHVCGGWRPGSPP
jgi:hypothetical protein